jgi:hypothetical protein
VKHSMLVSFCNSQTLNYSRKKAATDLFFDIRKRDYMEVTAYLSCITSPIDLSELGGKSCSGFFSRALILNCDGKAKSLFMRVEELIKIQTLLLSALVVW